MYAGLMFDDRLLLNEKYMPIHPLLDSNIQILRYLNVFSDVIV